jgi:membrane protein YqaA with SNARE-associated domain
MKHEIGAVEPATDAATAPDTDDDAPVNGRSRVWMVLRFMLGLGALLLLVILLVRTLKPELEGIGRMFVERFGVAGIAIGTLLADGFHFPIPPQFYMLLGIAAQTPPVATIAATTLGSLIGGACGYALARRLGHIPRLAKWLERVGGKLGHRLGHTYAHRSVLLASFTPIAFSVLCYLSGFYRLRRSAFILMLALRVPKLVLYYYLVSVGWNAP